MDRTLKIGESKIIRNNKQTKTIHVKYDGNVYSFQVLVMFKNHEYKIFLHITPFKNILEEKPIFMRFVVYICY